MRLRNIPGAKEYAENSPLVIQEPEKCQNQWKEAVYHRNAPLHLEIGMGKGQFITAMAKRHPEMNYLGLEKMSAVLLRALQKREEEETEGITNLFYLRCDAENIPTYFGKGEVDRIYLNFSDPWPKDRHHKRRLTSREFLARYREILKEDGIVEFKTDNVPLFDFSLEEAEAAGWEILEFTRDLHKSPMNEGNIMTEYEERFSILGNKICKMVIRPKKEVVK